MFLHLAIIWSAMFQDKYSLVVSPSPAAERSLDVSCPYFRPTALSQTRVVGQQVRQASGWACRGRRVTSWVSRASPRRRGLRVLGLAMFVQAGWAKVQQMKTLLKKENGVVLPYQSNMGLPRLQTSMCRSAHQFPRAVRTCLTGSWQPVARPVGQSFAAGGGTAAARNPTRLPVAGSPCRGQWTGTFLQELFHSIVCAHCKISYNLVKLSSECIHIAHCQHAAMSSIKLKSFFKMGLRLMRLSILLPLCYVCPVWRLHAKKAVDGQTQMPL